MYSVSLFISLRGKVLDESMEMDRVDSPGTDTTGTAPTAQDLLALFDEIDEDKKG